MRDGRISHSLYLFAYDMRAHRFYITGTDDVEDPVSLFSGLTNSPRCPEAPANGPSVRWRTVAPKAAQPRC